MKEFFGIGGFQREPEGAWSWQHILFVSLVLITAISLAIWLGKTYANREDKEKNKVLIWAAILIDGFELIKIIVNCSIDGIAAMRVMLPLFLCSIQLIAIPLAAFSKGRIREASLDFVMIFGILGGVLGTVGAVQNYNAYPVLSMPNVVSAITHSISAFASLYIMVAKMKSMKMENMWITLTILGGFTAAALIANFALDYNYMFLMSHDGTPYVILWNLVGGIQVLYTITVIAIFVVYILGFYYIYNWIVTKTNPFAKKTSAELTPIFEAQAAIAVAEDKSENSEE